MKKINKLLGLTLLSLVPIISTVSIVNCGNKNQPDPTKCVITLDANGGSFDNSKTAITHAINKSSIYWQVKDNFPKPKQNLYKFLGYSFDKKTLLDNNYQFKESTAKLYALWEKESTVMITFDANGGSFDTSTTITKELLKGTLLKDSKVTNPTYLNHTFNGWSIDSKVTLDNDYALKENVTLKAIWIDQTTKYTITINKNLESASEPLIVEVPKGTTFKDITLPQFTRPNYSLRCFGDENGIQFSKNFIIEKDLNAKVWWKSDGTSEEQTAEEYIHNRSFSITNNEGLGVGTCWILSDATPNVLNDYEYYIATNLHVRVGIEDTTLGYAFSDSKDVLSPPTNYTTFDSFKWEDKSIFTYNKEIPSNAIDISIAKADFKNAIGSTKNKLDNLNKRQSIEGCITEFVNSVTADKHFENLTNISTGGYAGLESGYQWQCHSGDFDLEYLYENVVTHSTNDEIYTWDVSPQYKMKDKEVDWMAPGSSGSMLIGKDSDNTWKVLAIYWGGVSTSPEGKTKSLCFSCFKSDKGDFIDRYCTYHTNY